MKVNGIWKQIYDEVPQFYEQCQLNEVCRINFMNKSIVNFIQIFSHFLRGVPNVDSTLDKIKNLTFKKKQNEIVKGSLFDQMLLLYKGEKKPLQIQFTQSVPDLTPEKFVGRRLVMINGKFEYSNVGQLNDTSINSQSPQLNIAKQQIVKGGCLSLIELYEGKEMLKPLTDLKQFRQKLLSLKVEKNGGRLNFCIKLCVPYLKFKENYINLLLVNKHFSLSLKKSMIKDYLMFTETHNLRMKIMCWKSILVKEEQNLSKLLTNYRILPKDKRTDLLIDNDIKRSFNTHIQNNIAERDELIKGIESNLGETLKAYAYNNPSISYYQGMNMLMSFFIYSCWQEKNIQLAYNLFNGLIDLLLKEIFTSGLKKLRIHFFTLDRLIALYIPELFKHWNIHNIECGQYATVFIQIHNQAWHLTLFTYGLQVNNTIQIVGDNKVVFDIMDIIVAKGWAGFYQVTLGILKFYKDILLQLDFEQTLNFLNHMTKSAFFYYPIQDINQEKLQYIDFIPLTQIKILTKDFIITKQNLSEIEREYYQLREKIDQIVFQDK